jgi:hypothetical protein
MLADTKTRDLMKLDDLQQLALYCTNYITPEELVRKFSFFLVDMARLFQTNKKLVKKIARSLLMNWLVDAESSMSKSNHVIMNIILTIVRASNELLSLFDECFDVFRSSSGSELEGLFEAICKHVVVTTDCTGIDTSKSRKHYVEVVRDLLLSKSSEMVEGSKIS